MPNNSDFYTLPQENSSDHFTDFEVLASSKYCFIIKARKFGRWFILKALSDDYRDKVQYEMLLRKEYSIGFKFDHPNIVKYIDYVTVPPFGHCIQMEYIVGQRLDEYLTTGLSLKDKKRIVVQLCEGLKTIHAEQVIHRDFKFENILITENGHNAKIIDFGLSDADSYAILKGPAGTEGFTSPEQAEGSKTLDNRTDIYSLGIILQRFKLPIYYHPVIAKCVKENRDDRYQTIEAFLHAFTHQRQKMSVVTFAIVGTIFLIAFITFYHAPSAEPQNLTLPSVIANKPNNTTVSVRPHSDVPTTGTPLTEAPKPVNQDGEEPYRETLSKTAVLDSAPSLNALTAELHHAIDDIMNPYIEKKKAGINIAEHQTFMHQMERKFDTLKQTFFSRKNLGELRTILLQEYDRYWTEKICEYGRAGKVRQLTSKERREMIRRQMPRLRRLQDSLYGKHHQDTKVVQP